MLTNGGRETFIWTSDIASASTKSLTMSGNAVFGDGTGTDSVGGTNRLGALSVSGTSSFATSANSVNTTGGQTYSSAVTLNDANASTTYTFDSNGSGNIAFRSAEHTSELQSRP